MGFSQIKWVFLKNSHDLRAQIMWVYLKNGLYLRAHLFTKEHPRSQNCIRTSDDLKMRLEMPMLFARADNVGFSQIKWVFLKNPHYLQIMWVFSEKPTLSERNPYYLIR